MQETAASCTRGCPAEDLPRPPVQWVRKSTSTTLNGAAAFSRALTATPRDLLTLSKEVPGRPGNQRHTGGAQSRVLAADFGP